MVRGDGRPGRGQNLEEEDDNEYRARMDDPPDDVVAAVTRLNERREKTAEDNLTQHKCAAGALCVAPSGADVSATTHHCLDCRGKIHCAMWCGENWKEYLESDRNTYLLYLWDILDAFEQVIEGIDAEIAEKKAELNGLLATPTKSNSSPSNN